MNRAVGTPEARVPVFLFADESGTSATDPVVMVGAVAVHNVADVERAIRRAYDRALGDSSIWPDVRKRQLFAEQGFHFTEDSESVKQYLLSAMDSIQYRAYAVHAANDGSLPIDQRLTAMYGTLLSSVGARYREHDLSIVFEQNPSMDALYGRIVKVLKARVWGIETAKVYRGKKSAPCLAMTDYVLGVTRIRLSGQAQPFQENRFVSVGRNLAYLVDFDDDKHLGGRKHPIL